MTIRVAVVAPSCTLSTEVPARIAALTAARIGEPIEVVFHPQCFLLDGHFAGPDRVREEALVEVASDPSFEAVWLARGGYGACRIAESAIAKFGPAAREKRYLGYSDGGYLLAGLYRQGIGQVAHGPMASDVRRDGGEAAVLRSLDWLAGAPPAGYYFGQLAGTPLAAFNLTVFSQLLGTALQPDLTGHVLMLEDVDEAMYRLDRSLFHITSNPGVRAVAGIMLGRCSNIPVNDPAFVLNEEQIARHWCARGRIAWLGRADIGHDADNKVVPFG